MRLLLFPIFLLLLAFTTTHAQTNSPSPPGWDNTLRRIHTPILMYHYVSPIPENADDIRINLTIEPHLFRAHMQYLHENGYTPISLYELDQALLTGSPLPARPVVLTFDDSYIDHYTYVFPLLKEYGFTGTFFVITALADNNHPAHLAWSQIAEMAAHGMSMESHTKSHPDLRQRDRDFLVYQVLGSLESLAAHTGQTTHMFAYPVGRYDAVTLDIVKELPIWRAVTTQHGGLHTTTNRLELPRVRINGNASVAELAALLNTR